ncbi:putative metallopeptidase [Paenibacillus sp. Marseille-Q4541]|uniref:putative metallopeptidase n=1 Tax=Paenibacillus sp. Marseille-Q4541 TaxID=2831522 RepID=UPI001BA51907|nr:putative metallopeptidase [Paenibacillus sp. Marseille-Q4541]
MAKADKFHTEAIEETYDLLRNMIEEHHDHFEDTEILILMKHGGWKSKGKTVFGKFKVLGDDLRSTWGKDAILYLNAEIWNRTSEPQRRFILDNALYSLDLKTNKHGDTLEAADGRPLLKTIPPDIEAYVEVIKRHGTVTEDVKRLALAIKEVNVVQLTIEDAGRSQEQQPQQEPREGKRGNINLDGTVEVEDDPNQVKLEEAIEAAAKNDPTSEEDDLPPLPDEDDSL